MLTLPLTFEVDGARTGDAARDIVTVRWRHGRVPVIPTLILAGLVLGRWWRTAIAATAITWPVVLVASGVMNVGWGLLDAAAIAVPNTAVGVLVHQGLLWVIRRQRSRDVSARTS